VARLVGPARLCAAVLAATALAVWPALVQSAAPAVEESTTMDPATIRFGSTRTITYRLELKTGAAGAHVAVDLHPPTFGTGTRSEGSPVAPIGDPEIDGPGSVESRARFEGQLACAPSGVRAAHGYELVIQRAELRLQPSSVTSLWASYRLGKTAPWPSTDFRLRYTITPLNDSGRRDTSLRVQHVLSPAPRVTGATGVELLLSSRPSLPRRGQRGRGLRRGERVSFQLRTHPHLSRRHVTLRYTGPGHARKLHRLATLTSDRHGRFAAYRWVPPRAGAYEVWAFYRSRSKRIRSDYSCPLTFRVV
jgi:hypothetical protein